MGTRRCKPARATGALCSLGMSASADFIFRNQFPKLNSDLLLECLAISRNAPHA
jgi:hypothetical protein